MAYLDVPGARLWFEDSGGSGVPVLFVHAAAGSSESWAYQVRAFAAAGYRCVTFDLRGWRKSAVKAGAAPSHMSDDIEALREHLGLDRFVLIANAYGGFGGVDYALRFNDRLRAFVLSSSQGGLQDEDYVAVRNRIAPPELRAMPIHLRELGPTYRTEHQWGTLEWQRLVDEAGGETAQRQTTKLRVTLRMLETLTVPTLMITGDADLLSPPGLMRLMAARVPGCEFATIPEAGHSAYWERPDAWNGAVLDFLTQSVKR